MKELCKGNQYIVKLLQINAFDVTKQQFPLVFLLLLEQIDDYVAYMLLSEDEQFFNYFPNRSRVDHKFVLQGEYFELFVDFVDGVEGF